MLKLVYYTPFLQWSVQLQIVLFIRLLCSLPTTVCDTVSNIVHQVALLPFYNSKAIVSSLCSQPVLIYLKFICIFEWKERVWEYLGTWFISGIIPHQSHIHTRWGFHPGLQPGLIPLLILCFELCVEISPLCFPPTTVCEVANSVVCQVAMLSSFNSLWG